MGVKRPSDVTSVMANTTLDHWFYPWFGSPGHSSALLVSRADMHNTRGRHYIRFRISRRFLEEQSGVKMELGNVYELTGEIVGICGFHTFRGGTTSDTLYLHLPSVHQDRIVPRELYQIRIDSIVSKEFGPEVASFLGQTRAGMNWGLLPRRLNPIPHGAPGPFQAPASLVGKIYEIRGEPTRFRFDFWRSTFEAKAGFHFEVGPTYIIRGKVVGICDFETEHEQTESNQHVQIEVPSRFRNAFRHGETYEIRISSISKQGVVLSEQERKLGEIWDWVQVAAWIDTEGYFHADASTSTYRVGIQQKEKLPLMGICAFLRMQGIEGTVVPTRSKDPRDPSKTHYGFALITWGAEGLAKIIRNTEPYIKTQNKRNQIARCKKELAKPRKRLEEKVIRARLLLGIPPEGIRQSKRS